MGTAGWMEPCPPGRPPFARLGCKEPSPSPEIQPPPSPFQRDSPAAWFREDMHTGLLHTSTRWGRGRPVGTAGCTQQEMKKRPFPQ